MRSLTSGSVGFSLVSNGFLRSWCTVPAALASLRRVRGTCNIRLSANARQISIKSRVSDSCTVPLVFALPYKSPVTIPTLFTWQLEEDRFSSVARTFRFRAI